METLPVVYDPPGMGSTRVPNPISGEGTLRVADDGLHVVGKKSLDVSMLGAVGVVATILLGAYFGLGVPIIGGLAVGVIAAVTAVRFTGKKQIEVHYPWSTVRSIRYDEQRGAVVLLIKGAKPKGELFIEQPKGSPLHDELQRRLAGKS